MYTFEQKKSFVFVHREVAEVLPPPVCCYENVLIERHVRRACSSHRGDAALAAGVVVGSEPVLRDEQPCDEHH